ncbi:MAG TPA: hypothetical protein VHT96_12395 [Clostridia bacterium]|nr:hypothetical protein [Clostridia bacterium]
MDDISGIAQDLINRNLKPIQAYIVLKDILKVPKSDSLLADAEQKVLQCRWVKELEESQEPDGTWGRFHTMDSRAKRKFPTTEQAVRRALALGLDENSDILKKAALYMSAVIKGETAWQDKVEKFNEWPVNTRMITAATLSGISRNNPDLNGVWSLWSELARHAFSDGRHDLDGEIAAFSELTGIVPTRKSTKLGNMYPLILLSATDGKLPSDIEKAYLDWIWNNDKGIYYLTWFNMDIMPGIASAEFPLWLRAIDVFSGYDYGKSLAENSINYIWSLQDKDGLWDFGAGSKSAGHAKNYCGWLLSDSWRDPSDRKTDCTIRILLLLKKYAQKCQSKDF